MELIGMLVIGLLGQPTSPASGPATESAKEKDTETPLFNARDLEGWSWRGARGDTRNPFSVVDGILRCEGRPAGYLQTRKKYTNFVLRLEWRWPKDSKPGNNGILVRVQEGEHYFGDTWPKSIEVQLANQRAGDIFTIGQFPLTTGRNEGRYTAKLKPSSEKPQGEWNNCEVTLEDGKITIKVNGELQNEGNEAAMISGSIGLQSEGAPIEYRNIRLIPKDRPEAEK